MSRSAGWIAILVVFTSLGCRGSLPTPDVAAEEVDAKIPGIKRAAEDRDRSALPELVESLNDEDPAVRLFAIVALEKFTGGDRFEYAYYLDSEQRKPSLARWREWLRRQGFAGPQTQPSPPQP